MSDLTDPQVKKLVEGVLADTIEALPQPRYRAWLRLSISIALKKFNGDMVEVEKWLGLEVGTSRAILKKE